LPKIAVIPGDGIGIDVTVETTKVLEAIEKSTGIGLELTEFDFGAEKYLTSGISMPEEMFDTFRNEYDAIFLGALGQYSSERSEIREFRTWHTRKTSCWGSDSNSTSM
jgi:isocitrate/isopropylmalate dehydrogenase